MTLPSHTACSADGKMTFLCSAGSAELREVRLVHHLPWTTALEEPWCPTVEQLRDLQLLSAPWHPPHLLTYNASIFKDRVKKYCSPSERVKKILLSPKTDLVKHIF